MHSAAHKLAWMLLAAALLPLHNANAAGRGDPLRPPGYASPDQGSEASKAPSWQVNQILLAENRRVAVINNTSVSRGDFVNGARVLDITPTHVELQHEDRVFKVRFPRVPVKKHRKQTANY